MTPDERFEADEKDRLLDTVAELREQLAEARRTAEYWKAEHLAGNKQLAERDKQVKEACAALCYEQNWLIHGSEMAALIEATKEEE